MKLIILDRDGVINHDSDNYIRTVDQWIALPGSITAIANLSKAGYTIAISTNQSGIGRGYYTLDTLHAMHDKMLNLVTAKGGEIHKIVYCPHTPDDYCTCRKPKPGMLNDILKSYPNANAKDSQCWFVGDSLRDIEAAQAIEMQSALVKTGKGQRTLDKGMLNADTPVFDDLLAFSRHLI